MAFVFLEIIVGLAIWIYMSFAFMAIAKRLKQSAPGIAWIPGIGPLIIAFRASKMHWWPWLLIIGFFIPFLNFIAMILFVVYEIIWLYKMFKALGRPGWWAVVPMIVVIVGAIIMMASMTLALVNMLMGGIASGGLTNMGSLFNAGYIIGMIIALLGEILFLVFVGKAAWGKK